MMLTPGRLSVNNEFACALIAWSREYENAPIRSVMRRRAEKPALMRRVMDQFFIERVPDLWTPMCGSLSARASPPYLSPKRLSPEQIYSMRRVDWVMVRAGLLFAAS